MKIPLYLTKHSLPIAALASLSLHIGAALAIDCIIFNIKSPPKMNSETLGLEKGSRNSIAWIGFEEFEKQYAKVFEKPQAALKNTMAKKETVENIPLSTPSENEKKTKNTATEKSDAPNKQLPANTENEPSEKHDATEKSAERDSDPTALIKVSPDLWKLGRPLSRVGIKIYPKRPPWTALQKVLQSGQNPVIEISFDKNGRVASSGIFLLHSTGDTLADHVIKANCASWRASGQPLKALKKEDTLTLKFEIILQYQ